MVYCFIDFHNDSVPKNQDFVKKRVAENKWQLVSENMGSHSNLLTPFS
ncbi:hypothetical protein HMPREF1885_01959 [Streptococcus agalactiae]|nr:hypothetical protein HMPREF1885_01959 [Streptococcus agalactiae]